MGPQADRPFATAPAGPQILKFQLRALTSVPVVMKKCVMCHEHYADAKEGEAIGAISYTFPIE